MAEVDPDFYLRFYSGRKGKAGFDHMEFEFQPSGKFRYVNNTKYKREGSILKTVYVSKLVLSEVQRLVQESTVLELDDGKWPEPTKDGKIELEVVLGEAHISFSTAPIDTALQTKTSEDPKGLQKFHNLVQDLRCLVLPLVSTHFKINPLGENPRAKS